MRLWQEVRELHLGAEARVSLGRFIGTPAVMKARQPRSWRHPALDGMLTERRLNAEARVLRRLRLDGIKVPILLDFEPREGLMVMEYIEAPPFVESLHDKNTLTELGQEGLSILLADLGKLIRKIHAAGVMHGDLTTHNLLWSADIGFVPIDFGLAQITSEVERLGIDLHVLHESLGANHPNLEGAMEWVVEGYISSDEGESEGVPTAKEVVNRLDEIRQRGRYHN